MSSPAIDYRNIPVYPIGVASRYILLSPTTARSWVDGRGYPTSEGPRRSRPVLELQDPRKKLASFTNLIELFMIHAIRKEYKVPMHQIRRAIDYLQREWNLEHPLAHKDLKTDGKYILVSQFDLVFNASKYGQQEMPEVIDPYLNRIEWDDDYASRLYPQLKNVLSDAIYIDPRVKGGRPCIKGTGITTSTLADRWSAGESFGDLAEDFAIDIDLVEEAIRFEQAS